MWFCERCGTLANWIHTDNHDLLCTSCVVAAGLDQGGLIEVNSPSAKPAFRVVADCDLELVSVRYARTMDELVDVVRSFCSSALDSDDEGVVMLPLAIDIGMVTDEGLEKLQGEEVC